MITTISSSTAVSGKTLLKKGLLFCGIVSSLFYVAMNIIVPLQYAGYNPASQTLSELYAIGTSTRPLWVSLGAVYSLFVIAFGWGILKSAGEKKPLRIAGKLMIISIIFGLFWPPMHQREVLAAGGGTITDDTLHIFWTLVTTIIMLLIMSFTASAFGKRFESYSIVTMAVLLVFGAITGLESAKMEANLPTPWIGVYERICIGAYMLWIIVLAIALLQREKLINKKDIQLRYSI